MLNALYYRYCYLRNNPISRIVGSLIPPSAVHWNDAEFDRLHDPLQDAHNLVLLSLVPQGRSILELGCGTGTLVPRLKGIRYSHYTGIDLSQVAIGRCEPLSDSCTEFFSANAERYIPSKKYDSIILNESLYYFATPIDSLKRYMSYLNGNGRFLVSISITKERNAAVSRKVKEVFTVKDQITVSSVKGSWEILSFCE